MYNICEGEYAFLTEEKLIPAIVTKSGDFTDSSHCPLVSQQFI